MPSFTQLPRVTHISLKRSLVAAVRSAWRRSRLLPLGDAELRDAEADVEPIAGADPVIDVLRWLTARHCAKRRTSLCLMAKPGSCRARHSEALEDGGDALGPGDHEEAGGGR
jgi:hypothetical protein